MFKTLNNYSIVYTNSNCNNAFFLKNFLLKEKVKASQFEHSFKIKTLKETIDDEIIDLMKFPTIQV